MRSKLRGRLSTVLAATALIVAVLGWSTPAIAHGVQHALFAHNADKVDGRHANQLVRLAGGHVTADVDNWLGTLITDTRTITAPNKGLLLITYSLDADEDADETGAGIGYVAINPKRNGSTIGDIAWQSFDFSDAAGACCQSRAITIQRIVEVGKGQHTVSVDITGPGGTQLVYIYERSLSVLYVPFKGNGAVPRPIIGAFTGSDKAARPQPGL